MIRGLLEHETKDRYSIEQIMDFDLIKSRLP